MDYKKTLVLLMMFMTFSVLAEIPSICTIFDVKCDPPATIKDGHIVVMSDGKIFTADWTVVTPFDALVRFGGEVKLSGGETYWQWIKAGEPAKQCTQAQATDKAAYQWGCSRKIGDVMFVSQRFKFSSRR